MKYIKYLLITMLCFLCVQAFAEEDAGPENVFDCYWSVDYIQKPLTGFDMELEMSDAYRGLYTPISVYGQKMVSDGEWVYFCVGKERENGDLYRVSADGGVPERMLANALADEFMLHDGFIYGRATKEDGYAEGGRLVRISTETFQCEVLIDVPNMMLLDITNTSVYFCVRGYKEGYPKAKWRIFRVDHDGKNLQMLPLPYQEIFGFQDFPKLIIYDGWIYYWYDSVYRITLDGKQRQVVWKNSGVLSLDYTIDGSNVYCYTDQNKLLYCPYGQNQDERILPESYDFLSFRYLDGKVNGLDVGTKERRRQFVYDNYVRDWGCDITDSGEALLYYKGSKCFEVSKDDGVVDLWEKAKDTQIDSRMTVSGGEDLAQVPIYRAPSLSASILDEIDLGETVLDKGRELRNFREVLWQGQTGYIEQSYLFPESNISTEITNPVEEKPSEAQTGEQGQSLTVAPVPETPSPSPENTEPTWTERSDPVSENRLKVLMDCNLRRGADLLSEKLGTIGAEKHLEWTGNSMTDGRGNLWYEVAYNSGVGWVSSKYVELDVISVKAVSGDTILRAGPGLAYESVGILKQSETLLYAGQTEYDTKSTAWYSVVWGEDRAWVSSRYTTLN